LILLTAMAVIISYFMRSLHIWVIHISTLSLVLILHAMRSKALYYIHAGRIYRRRIQQFSTRWSTTVNSNLHLNSLCT